MKYPLFQIVGIANTLVTLQQDLLQGDERVPVKFGYAVDINLKRLLPMAQSFEDQRQKLIDQFCQHTTPTEEGAKAERVTVSREVTLPNGEKQTIQDLEWNGPDAMAECEKAINDLASEEVEADFHKVSIDAFPATLPYRVIAALGPMVREDA